MAKIKLVPILVAVVAIGIAFAVSLMVYSKFQNKPTIGKPVAVDTIPIAVASIDVPWGTSIVIDKSMIKMVPYLKKGLPSGCFSDLLALEGRILVYPVKTDEPIFESRLAPTSVTIGGIAAVLTPKKRAMSVKVNAVIGISGFIHPNNRVDVLVTINRKEGGTITKIVLENILVLAVGSTLGDGDKKDKSQQRGVREITLEVTPEEGEQLALATNKGAIQLALRNFADTEDVITTGSTTDTLLASYSKSYGSSKSHEPEATDKPWKIQMYNVIVIKGTKVSKVAF